MVTCGGSSLKSTTACGTRRGSGGDGNTRDIWIGSLSLMGVASGGSVGVYNIFHQQGQTKHLSIGSTPGQ